MTMLPPLPGARSALDLESDNMSQTSRRSRFGMGPKRSGLSSAFVPVCSDAGERFSLKSYEKDMQMQPGPGAYSDPAGLGRSSYDSDYISHRAAGFGGPAPSTRLPMVGPGDAIRNGVSRLFRKMQTNKSAAHTLADIWDQCGRTVRRNTGQQVRRNELWRGLASLGLQLVDADLDILLEMTSVTQADGNIDLRELARAVERTGLNADVPPSAVEEHIDGMVARCFARSPRHGRTPRPPADGAPRKHGSPPARRRGHALGSWQLASEDAGKPMQEQLRNALTRQAVRVIDLFREWDTSMDGELSLREFEDGVKRLGFKADHASVEALFKSWDADGSGAISLMELNKILRRGGTISLASHLRFDADAHAKKQKEAAKSKMHKAARKFSRGLQRKAQQEGGGMNVDQENLLKKMAKQREKLLAFFKSWDSNGDGYVSRAEYLKGLPLVGIMVQDKELCNSLFDTMDHEGSGRVAITHLQACLQWAGKPGGKGGGLIKIHIDESLPLVDQIKDALSANAARVIDLFREFDDDGDGEISILEFQKAMPVLGLPLDREQCKELFAAFDGDGGGSISFREFNKLLRRDAVYEANRKKKKEGPVEVIEIVSLPSLMRHRQVFEQQVMREEANANAERQRQEKLLAKQTRTDRRSRDTREGAGSFVQR